MIKRRPSLVVASLLVSGWSATAVAAPGDPIQLSTSHCAPGYPTKDASGQRLEFPGYVGDGYGTDPATEYLKVHLARHTVTAGDDVAAALADTDRIELCFALTGSGISCPSAGPWLLYDKASGAGVLQDADFTDDTVAEDALSASGASGSANLVRVEVPIPWHLPFWSDVVIFPVVNRDLNADPNDMTATYQTAPGGFCKNWESLASAGQFEVIGTYDETGALCSGSTVGFRDGGYAAGRDICLDPHQAEYTALVFGEIEESFFDRVQRLVPRADRHTAAWNGDAGHPVHIFLGPHNVAWGQAITGGVAMNVPDFRTITYDTDASGNFVDWQVPSLALAVGPGRNTRDVLRLSSHEYAHKVQQAYARELPLSWPHLSGVGEFSESQASSFDNNLCLMEMPYAVGDCTSPGKLGRGGGEGDQIFQEPARNGLFIKYNSAIFWRYLYEQFSFPTESIAHPSTTASRIPRTSDAPGLALDTRPSDEGADLLGQLFQEFGRTGAGVSTYDAMDVALRANVGRSFDDMVFDFHTAMYLKDYNDTDARWGDVPLTVELRIAATPSVYAAAT